MEPVDVSAFEALEHAGWERVSGRYEEYWAGLTSMFVAPLLRAGLVCPGTRLLDVACGLGPVSEAARALGADPVGIDFSGTMIARARELHPGLEFHQGDAQELPFAAGSFDAVTMNFGLLHLGEPDRALEEARRVLRPGGTFAFSAWAESAGTRIVEQAVLAHADLTVPLPEGPPFFRFSDPAECRRSLAAAGFSRFVSETLTVAWVVPSPAFLFEAERDAGVRTAALLARQPAGRLAAIRSAIETGVRSCAVAGGFSLEMTALLTAAAA